MSFSIVLKCPNGIELRILVEADTTRPEKANFRRAISCDCNNENGVDLA